MQLKIFVLAAFLSWPCVAQDTLSVYARLAPAAPSSGNGYQIGVGVDGVVHPTSYLMFDVDTSVVKESKSYVGNGWTWRGQAETLVGAKSFWFGGGILGSRHSNSQYTKWQYQPIASVHYRPRMEMDLYASYLFRAYGNDNQVQGYRLGYRGIVPVSGRLGLFAQGEYTRFRFLDSFGQKHASGGWVSSIGVSRINN